MNKTTEHKLKDFDFFVPKELISQKPLKNRDASNLIVLNKTTGAIEHKKFFDICKYLNSGDCLVINRTKVIPVRLYGKKETGGKVEVLFLNPFKSVRKNTYEVLIKPSLNVGKKIIFEDNCTGTVAEKRNNGETVLNLSGSSLLKFLHKHGNMPLPPYIKRRDNDNVDTKNLDRERYQTVYSKNKGSIAAPTAGLHFTHDILKKLKQKGVNIAEIVLHVGWGTFKPIKSKILSEHKMLPEYYEISKKSANTINHTIEKKGKIIAVGTTSVRALESAATNGECSSGHLVEPGKKHTSIFIYPGYRFKIADNMITNLHLPQSTPLMMVCAFAGRKNILNAYKNAVDRKYRFFSYGDSMAII
ncbi:tRNA preQ1(34) S-adenosylmethionine ribosyltransferase-isomerase QueA [Elusimicrobiota bacterium]